jgi:hypothetical protein
MKKISIEMRFEEMRFRRLLNRKNSGDEKNPEREKEKRFEVEHIDYENIDTIHNQNKNPFITTKRLGRNGRLGNQLFQIAAVLSASESSKITAVFPKWYCNYDKIDYSQYFKNKLNQTLEFTQPISTYTEPDFTFTPLPIFSKNTDLYGYFQSDMYFINHNKIIEHFFEPDEDIIKSISEAYSFILNGNTCSIHVRRGDYINNQFHDVCGLSYYNKGIDEMKKRGIEKFLVFSDDISWCKENFKEDIFYFIEGNNPMEDIFLMGLCNNNIISNSSFSWWGSWFNKNPEKIVIAPNRWFTVKSPITNFNSIYRKDMILI